MNATRAEQIKGFYKEAKAKLAKLRSRRIALLQKDDSAEEEAKRSAIYRRLNH